MEWSEFGGWLGSLCCVLVSCCLNNLVHAHLIDILTFETVKVCIRAKWPTRLELILVSVAWSTRSISTPPGWDASSLVPIYTPGWREALWEYSVLPKNTTQCLWPGRKPGPLDLELSALTMRPLRLPPVETVLLSYYYLQEATGVFSELCQRM